MAEPDLQPDLQLAAWLAIASAGNPDRLTAIATGTAALSRATSTTTEILDMVLLAHGVPEPEAAARLAAAISEHDPSFDGQPGNLQTQIAAGWTLKQILTLSTIPAVTAALAVASADFCRLQSAATELPAHASAELDRLQRLARRRHPLPKGRAQKNVVTDEVAAEGAIGGAQLRATADALTAAINTVQRSHSAMVDAVQTRLAAADEETDMLWWTMSERHEGDGQPWAELGAAAPLLAGRDIAALTSFVTPPPTAPKLLARVLADIPPQTIAAGLAALPADVDDKRGHIHPLLPIGSAAQGATSAVPSARAYPAAELAEQSLVEILIERQL
jgi:hypothetical protein